MGTEVLRPQDVLVARLGVHTPPCHGRRHVPGKKNSTNLTFDKKKNYSGHKKTSPKRKSNAAAAETRLRFPKPISDQRRKDDSPTGGGPVMGKVTILKRGESLSSIVAKINAGNPSLPIGKSIDDLDVRGGENIRSEPSSSIVSKVNGGKPSSPIGKSIDDLHVRGGENIRSEPSSSTVSKINAPIGEIFRSESPAMPHPYNIYAGSVFFESPSPSCVPLPTFFSKSSDVDSEIESESEISQSDDGVVALLDPNSVECFYPSLKSTQKVVLMNSGKFYVGLVSIVLVQLLPYDRWFGEDGDHGMRHSEDSLRGSSSARSNFLMLEDIIWGWESDIIWAAKRWRGKHLVNRSYRILLDDNSGDSGCPNN